jgi:lactobin A/cerein 7B family class IIb bacteriocin
MNAHETTEIRELTAQELDHVNGGFTWILGAAIGAAVATVGIGALVLSMHYGSVTEN